MQHNKAKNFIHDYRLDSPSIIDKCRHWFLLLIICQLTFWTLMPSLLLKNTYVDILENLAWGQHLQWGYDKDPFLGGVITYFGYLLSGKQIWSAYLFSQISIVICFWAVWQLAKRILPPIHALIAVSLLVTIHFFNHSSPEFNDDILQLPLWALTCLYFYDAIQHQKITRWLLVGVFAGLALMAKYYSIMLLFSMLFFALMNEDARKSFTKPGIYLAILVFSIIVTPNLIWLVKNSFISIHYAFDRAAIGQSNNNKWLEHLSSPLSYLFCMVEVILPPLLVTLLCFRERNKLKLKTFDQQFLLFLCFGPLALTTIFSLFTGAHIHFMWATPLFSLFGIFLMVRLHPVITRDNLRRYIILTTAIFLTWVLVYLWGVLVTPFTTQRGGHETFPGKTMSQLLTKEWHDRYHTPLYYVAGERELTLNLSQYSTDHPEPFFEWRPDFSPWINTSDLQKHGAIFICRVPEDESIAPSIMQHFARTEFQAIHEYDWAVLDWAPKLIPFKKMNKVRVLVGFLPPADKLLSAKEQILEK